MEIYKETGIILEVKQGIVYMLNHKGYLGHRMEIHDAQTAYKFCTDWLSNKHTLLKQKVYAEINNTVKPDNKEF